MTRMRMVRNEVFSVIVICTGNVARSRYAASLLQRRFEELPPGQVDVRSAGTEAREGMPVEARTLESLRRHGIQVPMAPSKRLRADMLAEADLVLGATVEHIRHAMTLSPSTLHRTFTLTGLAAILECLPEDEILGASRPGEVMRRVIRQAARHRTLGLIGKDIPDPYGQSDSVHAVMETMVEDAVARIAEKLLAAVRRH